MNSTELAQLSRKYHGTFLRKRYDAMDPLQQKGCLAVRARFMAKIPEWTGDPTRLMEECQDAMLNHWSRGTIQGFIDKWGTNAQTD